VISLASGAELTADAVILAVGAHPNVDFIKGSRIELSSGIVIDQHCRTSKEGIYAAGDVIGGMMLAYVSFVEGKVAAENAMGRDSKIDYRVVPQCIFTSPEVASVGLTEEEAITQGHQVRIGRFPFIANAMATIVGEHKGLVKIITERKYGQILGVHIIGPRATSLIPEVALAMKLEATFEDIVATIHVHPTLSEAVWESALDVTGEAIHILSRGKR